MEKQHTNDDQKDSKLDQNQKEKPMSPVANCVVTGFIGGLFWSIIAQLAYYFHFSEIGPNMLLSFWKTHKWASGVLGFIITILLCSLISIAIAFIYYVILRKMTGLLLAVFFGLVIWALVHFALIPLFPNMKTISELDMNTIITTICIYILYGVFIGVSISFEEKETQRRKEADKQSPEVQS
ncbi:MULTISPECIES: YqhR family membrane protein [Bacillus]|uniref:YqhR family membrane protein n=1 Tax=Bacillus TaxID=1386 RepID=UPI0002EB4752|nr:MULTISPECIES: YqhR family membrane protein [Bacillus]